jgi:hypothetical protein
MRYGLVNFDDVSQQIEAAVAEAEAEHKDADPVVGLHYAQDNTNAPHMAFSALKFLFVYTLIAGFVELRRSPKRCRVVSRTVLLLAIIVVGAVGFFLRSLKAEEDVENMKRYVAQVYPISGSMRCDAFDEETSADLNLLCEKAVAREQDRPDRWWSLQSPDMQFVTWSWNQLKPLPPNPNR